MAWVGAGVAAGTVAGSLISANAASGAANTQAASGKAAIDAATLQNNQARTDLAPYRDLGMSAMPLLKNALGIASPTDAYTGKTPEELSQIIQSLQAQKLKTNDPLFDAEIQKATAALNAPAGGSSNPMFGSLTKPFSFDITKDPGYQFRLDEGTKALENSASARGTQLTGATLKELIQYGQNYASGEFNTAFQRDQATKSQLYGMLTGAVGIGQGSTNTTVGAGTNAANTIGNTATGIGNAQAAGQVGTANAISGGISNASNSALSLYTLRQIMNPSTTPIMGGVNLPSAGTGDIPTTT